MVASPSNKVNGTTLDGEGRQVLCEHSTSSLVRLERDGSRTVLATHWDGKELNSPNDVVLRSDGQIYFTDPPYGRWPGFGVERDRELDICGVYRIDGAGDLHLEVDDFNKPNGLCFSVDESVLYINDTEEQTIRRFAVAADGSLSGGDVLFEMPGPMEYARGVPDGMKLDAAGNLWCTGPGGVWVVSPDGEHLGTHPQRGRRRQHRLGRRRLPDAVPVHVGHRPHRPDEGRGQPPRLLPVGAADALRARSAADRGRS